MGYTALYRKYRPLVFSDMVGQEHIVKTLRHSIEGGRIAHAYLFCGTRGTGKTTAAQIFARAINCLDPVNGDPCNRCEICEGILTGKLVDVVDIDAASNNSVDNVREIRDEVVYLPTKARYKVYIIDEVHMLSSGAFNALLKTLEEPPAHVIFLLATTEPHKLPATILSRCQRFDFRRIGIDDILGRIRRIAGESGVEVEEDALKFIAKAADGAMRDALSLLDQCLSLDPEKVTYEHVAAMLGLIQDEYVYRMAVSIYENDVRKAMNLIDLLSVNGKDIGRFVSDLVMYYRDMLICKISDQGKDIDMLHAAPTGLEDMKSLASGMSREAIIDTIRELSQLEADLKWSVHPRVLLEVAVIKLCSKSSLTFAGTDLLDRINRIEESIRDIYQGGERISHSAGSNVPDAGTMTQNSHNIGPKPEGKVDRGLADKKNPDIPLQEENLHEDQFEYLEFWEKLLQELKKDGRLTLVVYLTGTKAALIGENVIGIVFDEDCADHKKVVGSGENSQLIQKRLEGYLGRPVRIKCIDKSDLKRIDLKKDVEAEDKELEKARKLAEKFDIPFQMVDE